VIYLLLALALAAALGLGATLGYRAGRDAGADATMDALKRYHTARNAALARGLDLEAASAEARAALEAERRAA
jgi:hypothetical protein